MITVNDLASWDGCKKSAEADAFSVAGIRELLALCKSTLAVLSEYKLLTPTRVAMPDWYDLEARAGSPKIEDVQAIVGADLEAEVLAVMAAHPGRIPTRLVIEGTGTVLEPNGVDWHLQGLVELTAQPGSKHCVSIQVYCDAFMTHDLYGAAQPERHALNAPRLEQALTTIHRDIVELDGMSTKRATTWGFEVKNLTYDDGEVFAVREDLTQRHGPSSSLFASYVMVMGARLLAGSGDEVRDGYRADFPKTRARITLTQRHATSIEALCREFALDLPGIAPLHCLEEASADTPYDDVLIEQLPPGALPTGTPMPEPQVIAIGIRIADILAAADRWIGGICPETIYVDADGRFATLAPRGPRFIATAPQRSPGLRSYRVPYEGYEVLVLGKLPTPANDVFALCATLQTLITGAHPFGAEFPEIMGRMLAGAPPDPHPGELGVLLARGLAADPTTRPSAGELARLLRGLV